MSNVLSGRISRSHAMLSKDLRFRLLPMHQSVAWRMIGRLPEFRIPSRDQCEGSLIQTSSLRRPAARRLMNQSAPRKTNEVGGISDWKSETGIGHRLRRR